MSSPGERERNTALVFIVSLLCFCMYMCIVAYVFCGYTTSWHINLCRLFNAKSIFMNIVLFQTIQFSISTQFECEKHFYFKLFGIVKQF